MPLSASQNFPNRSRVRAARSLALVCLPALLLAVIGFLYLRHEIAIAEREVREEARAVSAELTDALNRRWQDFMKEPATVYRKIDAIGGDWSRPSNLEPTDHKSARRASEKYRQALQLIAEGDTKAGEKILWNLSNDEDAKWTESGLRVQPLVYYQLAKLAAPNEKEFLEARLTYMAILAVQTDPSPLSELLFDRAVALAKERGLTDISGIEEWRLRWESVSHSREILAPYLNEDFLKRFSWQTWIDHGDATYHVVITPRRKFLPVSLTEIEGLAGEAVASVPVAVGAKQRHPLRFAIHYFEDKVIRPTSSSNEESMATSFEGQAIESASVIADVTGSPFGVKARLADPGAFHAAIRKKTWWLGGFLGLAVTCTGVGAWRTWRAIEKQRELNRQQSDFISSVSHELRAPVASIRLLGELLASGKAAQTDAEKRGEYARLIERESGRLSALVDNVLDLSRIGRGTKDYSFEPTDIAALVRDSVERMEPLAGERGVAITAELESPAEPPEIDPVAIQQALTNLLDNAIKFSPRDGKIEVTLKTGGTSFAIAVRDEGPGIPASEHERIFERFFRVGSELRRETEGIGIGLSLVRHIMEAHHGRVEVDSAPGEGSTFILVFPDRKNGPNPHS